VSEILSTLMLNYVAILWVNYLVVGPWADPLTFSFPYSPPIAVSAELPKLGFGVHWGFALFLTAAALLWLMDMGSRTLYEARVAGDGIIVARYAGISSVPLIIGIFCMAGALAGLAGAVEVAASTHRLQSGLSPGYGFMGILVAWLAGGRALAIVPCAIFYAGLLNGGFALQVSGIPPAISTILQPLLLLCILASLALRAIGCVCCGRDCDSHEPGPPRCRRARGRYADPPRRNRRAAHRAGGVLNLGIEGTMLIGAVGGFAGCLHAASVWTGLAFAAIAAGVFGSIYAVLVITLRMNQVVTGLAFSILGSGISAMVGKAFIGMRAPDTVPTLHFGWLSQLPFFGRALLQQDAMVYLALIIVVCTAFFLRYTRPGLVLRALGEAPDVLDSLGMNVAALRYLYVIAGASLMGLGGAYLSLALTPAWIENMTAGRGWIALALVIFAGWRPLWLLGGH
jgi:simple sugar transport system permease protein